MTIDCDKYRLSMPAVKAMADKLEPEARLSELGAIAVATSVPIIVVAHYFGELYGLSSQLYARIERLKHFYGVTDVVNVRS